MKKKERIIASCLFCLIILSVVIFTAVPKRAKAESTIKPIELSFATIMRPRAAGYVRGLKPWAEEIEKRSNGRVKVKFYLAGALGKLPELYDNVMNGVADIGFGSHSMNPKRFPLTSVMQLPFISPSTFVGSHTIKDLYEKFPEMRSEHKDVHVLFLGTLLPYEIHTLKKPIRNLDDIKGVKLGTNLTAAVKRIGAVPVPLPPLKWYLSLEKGVIDGATCGWGFVNGGRLYEVTKYHINAHLGCQPYWVAMNNNVWNNLPKDIQKIFTDVTNEMEPDGYSKALSFSAKNGIKKSKELGHEIIELSPQQMAEWKASAKPEWDKWVKEMEARGLPGQVVLKETVRLVEKYTGQFSQ